MISHLAYMSSKAKRIKEARESRHLTQEQLAAAMAQRGAKLSRGAVGNWERGKGIKQSNLEILAEVTGYRVEYIAKGIPPRQDTAAQAAVTPGMAAGYRLKGIQAALCPDLPARIGIASEVTWESVISHPGGLNPRMAEQIADETGLPVGFILDGDPTDLTREQAVALLGHVLREREARS